MYIALTRIPIRVTVLNMNSSRPYSMAKRGEQAAATKQRIIDAARELISSETPDFTLALVAESAGTSVQTVLRAFGNKEGLIVEAVVGPLSAEYATPPPVPRPVPEVVRRVFDEFEENGDRLTWLVANEHRIDGLATVIAGGRASHRERVTAAFADRLAGYGPADRQQAVAALLVATDAYVWKLLRRDLGFERKAAEAVVERLIDGVFATAETD